MLDHCEAKCMKNSQAIFTAMTKIGHKFTNFCKSVNIKLFADTFEF